MSDPNHLPSQASADPPPSRIPIADLGAHVIVPIAYFDALCARAYGRPRQQAPAPPADPAPPPVDPKVDDAFKFPNPESLRMREGIPGFRRVNFDQPAAPAPETSPKG